MSWKLPITLSDDDASRLLAILDNDNEDRTAAELASDLLSLKVRQLCPDVPEPEE